MKLNRLKLDNFRQHVDTEIEFGPGMTAIVGENGAGKTTVLDAILVALFGLKTEVTDNKDTYRNHFSDRKEGFQVTLDFTFGGDRYRIQRGENDATMLLLDGDKSIVAKGLADVTDAARRLLRMNGRQFVNSFCARQKQLAFLDYPKERRREEVARMLDYQRVKDAADLAVAQRKSLDGEIRAKQSMLEDPAALAAERSGAEERLRDAREALAARERELATLESAIPDRERLASHADRYLELGAQIATCEETGRFLLEKIADAEARLTQAREEERRWNDERHVLDEAEALDEELNAHDTRARSYAAHAAALGAIDELTKRRKVVEATIAAMPPSRLVDAEARLKDAQARARAADETLRAAEQRWQAAHRERDAEIARAEAALKTARESLAEAERLVAAGVCPTCLQPTTGGAFVQVLADRREAVVAAERRHAAAAAVSADQPPEVADAERAKAEADAEHSNAQNAIESERTAESQRDAARRDLEELIAQLEEKRAALCPDAPVYDPDAHEATKSRRDALKPRVAQVQELRGAPKLARQFLQDLEALRTEFEKEKAAASALKLERSTLPIASDDEARTRKDELAASRAQRDQLTYRIKETIQAVKNAEAEVERITNRERDFAVKRADLDRLADRKELNAIVAESLSALHAELSRRARPQLEEKASRHLADLTRGRYSQLRLTDDFEPEIQDDGLFKKVLSGGEEDVVALSLRLAFSEMIQERHGVSLSLLILDETFGSLDEERRHLLVERLRLLRGRFEQVIVISHIEEVNQTADRCLRLRRDPATRATVVDAQASGLDRITLA